MIENIEALTEKRVETWAVGSIRHGDPITTPPRAATIPTGDASPPQNQEGEARTPESAHCRSRAAPPPSATVRPPDPRSAQWKAASLFCGLGGLDLGFALSGIKITEAYDNSGPAVDNYNRNFQSVARLADLSIGSCPAGRADVLLAGSPCQGFSTTGKRQVDDPRNLLLGRIADAASAVRPRAIIVENVPAAASGPHGRHWRYLEDQLRWTGFNVRRVMLSGETAGLAQTRQRLFMLCWRGSEHRRIELLPAEPVRLSSAFSMLDGLPGHEPRLLTDPKKLAIAVRIAAGQKLSNVRIGARNVASWDVPEVYGSTTEEERRLLILVARMRRRSRVRDHGDGDPVSRDVLTEAFQTDPGPAIERLISAQYLREKNGNIELKHTFNGKYRRLHWDLPAPTVDSHFGRASYFLHPAENRALTLREAMRLQGLPDWYTIRSSVREAFKMVGNAVPPPMGNMIAAFVRDGLLKD